MSSLSFSPSPSPFHCYISSLTSAFYYSNLSRSSRAEGNIEEEVPSYVVNSYSITRLVVSGYRKSDEDNAVSSN